MYIKNIVIDGFKSYAQRTEVNGFDPKFNAITGLNGSGKSNILDSICFLLGISNLTQVRATNLQELVYKNGQAGVTKATVSICFDNTDKNQSPLGYEQYDEISVTRQVVIGGRNKYLINGSNANNSRVQDMFRSVQLNVNNPHFLIMQGRITKVLNMKPLEILSMIEEAAGTRLYESKKEAAEKTIQKKDMKLREIDTIVKEEITPTLTRLKQERSSYLEYQKIVRELEHLNKFYIAYQFVIAKETQEHSTGDLLEMQDTKQKLNDRQIEIAEKLKELEGIIAELEKKRDQEGGGVMERLQTDLTNRQKEDAKSTSNISSKKDTLKAEQKKLTQLKKQMNNDTSASEAKEKELQKLAATLEKLSEQSKADAEEYAAAQKHFHGVSAGLSSNTEGQDASLNDQLIAAKKEVSTVETETKQAGMHLKHAQADIKRKQAELKKTDTSYKKDKTAHENHVTQLNKIKADLDKLNYEDGLEESLQTEHRQLAQEVTHLRDKVEQLEARFPHLQFDYRNPEKNFDRRRVHGLVAKLIQMKDPATATALEVTAGGKLYQVVVDSEVTGKALLQKGELKRRVTIIPLNKISARAISGDVVRQAQNLVGKNNVHTALSLVGYEDQLQKAMEYVFGSAFVCSSMDDAKKVCYDQRIQRKCVTLDGDSFDPAGTLSGGARAQTGSVLNKLAELNEAQTLLNQRETQLHQIEDRIKNIRTTANKYRQLKQQYDLKSHEADLLDERLKQSTHHQQLEEIEALSNAIAEHENTLAQATERKNAAAKRVHELEDKIKNAKEYRERELKTAEQGVSKAKAKADKTGKVTKEKEQEVESIKLELEEITKDIATCHQQMAATEEAIKGYETQLEELCEAGNKTKDAVKEAQAALNKQKELLKNCNKDINTRANEQRGLQKDDKTAALQLQELEHKITKCNKDSKEAARQVESLLERYEWIADEKKYFGQPNTSYDFKTQDPKECAKKIQKLQETKEKLSKSVNMRAMNMLGKAEEQSNELMKKRQIVLSDKAKIEQVIRELDEKKNEALKKAHLQVNRDFGSIFSTLLPGTQAKLVPVDGKGILEGLEVKVAFGDVWKESLFELSGGQRSLVALSLILSLLLFKPAPLYILDEVDAALDLSHTQNIGQMLRSHFTHSQFIVVSLKDGMFNNANVLFKTKFVDGVSTVTRYAQQTSRAPLSSTSLHNAGGGGKNKKTSRNTQKRPRIDTTALDSENVE